MYWGTSHLTVILGSFCLVMPLSFWSRGSLHQVPGVEEHLISAFSSCLYRRRICRKSLNETLYLSQKGCQYFCCQKSHWRRWQTMVFIKPSSKKSTERNSQFFKESLTKEERVYREEQKVSLRVPKLHRFNKHHDVWSYCNVKKSLFQTSSKLLSLPYYDQHIETLKKKND